MKKAVGLEGEEWGDSFSSAVKSHEGDLREESEEGWGEGLNGTGRRG